jgi:hypothetical protein
MHLPHYLAVLEQAELELAHAFREVGDGHAEEVDVYHLTRLLGEQCDAHAEQLGPFVRRYRDATPDEPDRLHSEIFRGTRGGSLGLLRDLHDLYLMATECDLVWTLVAQGAQGARDEQLFALVGRCKGETAMQLQWLKTRLKQAAPQALVVAS